MHVIPYKRHKADCEHRNDKNLAIVLKRRDSQLRHRPVCPSRSGADRSKSRNGFRQTSCLRAILPNQELRCIVHSPLPYEAGQCLCISRRWERLPPESQRKWSCGDRGCSAKSAPIDGATKRMLGSFWVHRIPHASSPLASVRPCTDHKPLLIIGELASGGQSRFRHRAFGKR